MYDLIRETSKDEFVLSEMIRLGFWKDGEGQPSVSADLIKKKGELNRELRELLAKERKIQNPEKVIAEYRAKRMKESREKQQANREAREKAKIERAEKWKETKKKDILYLGEEISIGLNEKASDKEKLSKFDLPDFANAADLAKAMGIELGQLQFLAYNRKVSKVSHYKRFYMQKKSGGQRLISAPMPRLKEAQYWVLENILNKVGLHPTAHGFRAGHSIVSNAQIHVGQDVVINFDFKDFFPTLTFKRIKGAFRNMGYSEQIAIILTSLCTEPNVDEVEMDGQTYFVASGERFLPQGAPTSPALTNIICFKLDARMTGMAQSLKYKYSRYADDMTFSTSGKSIDKIKKIIGRVRLISEDEGFNLHPDKLRIMRKGSRQEVTGIIVNEQLGIDRRNLKKFRALLHQIQKDGMAGKTWGNGKDLASSMWGYANFVAMVKPEKGLKLLEEVKEIFSKNGVKPKTTAKPKKKSSKKLTKKIEEAQNKLQQNATPKPDEKKDDDTPSWKMW